jgi:hypothetical protein
VRSIARALAAGLSGTIFAAEFLDDAILPEHVPHIDADQQSASNGQTITDGGSAPGRVVTWANNDAEVVQLVNNRGEPPTFVATGKPSILDGLELPVARE